MKNMRISCRSEILLKESDFQKITSLLRNIDLTIADAMEEELSHATIVEDRQYPKNAVCMGSTVMYVDLSSNKRNKITLVYPDEVNLDDMKISVLSPVGCALLGLKKNCTIDWVMPNKKYAKFKVESVQQNPLE